MSTRKIIRIDEEKCNGCAKCVNACAEGALKMVNGKAKLVGEIFCDGFGDCLGECPTGALTIVEREADAYDERATRARLLKEQGAEAARRFDEAARAHESGQHPKPASGAKMPGGCPGMRMVNRTAEAAAPAAAVSRGGAPGHAIPSDLAQWPVQLHLVSPQAPYFKGRELAVLSTCSPVASADVHWRFIRGRAVVVACPKLDDTDGYVEKLAEILSDRSIPKALVVRMEVPCCGGLTAIVRKAAALTGRADLVVEEVTVGLNGDVKA
jgi:Pyruvate/2-oxoacid:ferredoxin oxidoreductase delta subunit